MEPEQGKFIGKDITSFKTRIKTLEKENLALKRSLFNLSLKLNQVTSKINYTGEGIQFHYNDYELFPGDLNPNSQEETEANVYTSSSSSQALHHKGEESDFMFKHELKGHTGAVYDVEFSPSGKLIASGSFDKTVRIWNGTAPYKEICCLKEHSLNVSDICWSKDSSEVLSGSYDNTSKIWDIKVGKLSYSYDASGLVQCAMFNNKDKNLFCIGTSRNNLLIIDRRAPEKVQVMKSQTMINSLSFYNDNYLISAGSHGYIDIWDIRTAEKCASFSNEPAGNTISDINLCKFSPEQESSLPKYLSVNGYDNVLRVYEIHSPIQNKSLELKYVLKGYKNKNWPIKSCLVNCPKSPTNEPLIDDMDIKDEKSTSKPMQSSGSFYIATGSADPFVYLYSIGEAGEPGSLVKKLEGHTDKVYAADINPIELTICSCSADSTLKIWSISQFRK